jgi:hypothetical protein
LPQGLDRCQKQITAQEEKDFWRILINWENIDEHPMVKKFAQSSIFKNIASVYLGSEAVLSNITLMHSFPTTKKPKHSQLWHLDADDKRLVVFYVYVSDVTEESGPFECILPEYTKSTWRPKFLRKHTLQDSEIVKPEYIDKSFSIIGKSGTVFACDTATIYHRGSRCLSEDRIALSIRYSSFSGLYPVDPIH